MDQNDPMEPIRKLGERLADKAKELGLEVVQFAIMPSASEGAPDMAQAVIAIGPDAFKTPEKVKEDQQLRDMEMHMRRDTTKEKIEAARRGAAESLAQQMGTTAEGLGLDDLPEIAAEEAELIECPSCGAELTTATMSPRLDHLFCSKCMWPVAPMPTTPGAEIQTDEEDEGPLTPDPQPEPEPEGEQEVLVEDDDDPFAGMSVDEMLAAMAKLDNKQEGPGEQPPLAGV